jgi:hypothetical protein
MSGKRTLREHRTAARAWDVARSAAQSSRSRDPAWAEWAKREARAASRALRKQQAGKGKGR